ncbi:MoaD/ThiS family protein [Gramella sp. BOM4]|nr:MoaD/ThiS family protein [Christiangramia bathymodioli]
MKIHVKYFGQVAEAVGKTEEVLDLEKGTNLQDFKTRQVRAYRIPDPHSVQIAVNQDLMEEKDLEEGDEIAFLPPFAGG